MLVLAVASVRSRKDGDTPLGEEEGVGKRGSALAGCECAHARGGVEGGCHDDKMGFSQIHGPAHARGGVCDAPVRSMASFQGYEHALDPRRTLGQGLRPTCQSWIGKGEWVATGRVRALLRLSQYCSLDCREAARRRALERNNQRRDGKQSDGEWDGFMVLFGSQDVDLVLYAHAATERVRCACACSCACGRKRISTVIGSEYRRLFTKMRRAHESINGGGYRVLIAKRRGTSAWINGGGYLQFSSLILPSTVPPPGDFGSCPGTTRLPWKFVTPCPPPCATHATM